MAEPIYINFTYQSPHEDVENCLGFNPDGSTNVKYVLNSLREKLMENVELIDTLLEKSEFINNLNVFGYNLVGVEIPSPIERQSLLDKQILKIYSHENEEEDHINIDNFSDSEEETNNDRLNILNNLSNQNDSNMIFENHSDLDTDTEDNDIISDDKNTSEILDRYSNFIEEEYESESE